MSGGRKTLEKISVFACQVKRDFRVINTLVNTGYENVLRVAKVTVEAKYATLGNAAIVQLQLKCQIERVATMYITAKLNLILGRSLSILSTDTSEEDKNHKNPL